MEQSYFRQVFAQITAILLAAGAAALFTFFQSLAEQTEICTQAATSATDAGILGGLIKGIHSYIIMRSYS